MIGILKFFHYTPPYMPPPTKLPCRALPFGPPYLRFPPFMTVPSSPPKPSTTKLEKKENEIALIKLSHTTPGDEDGKKPSWGFVASLSFRGVREQ